MSEKGQETEAPEVERKREAELRRELDTVQSSLKGLRARLHKTLAEWCRTEEVLGREELYRELHHLRRDLARLRRSRSYRAGRLLLAPARAAREALVLARTMARRAPLSPPRPPHPLSQ